MGIKESYDPRPLRDSNILFHVSRPADAAVVTFKHGLFNGLLLGGFLLRRDGRLVLEILGVHSEVFCRQILDHLIEHSLRVRCVFPFFQSSLNIRL